MWRYVTKKSSEKEMEEEKAFACAGEKVTRSSREKKQYSEGLRAEIAKYAALNGNGRAVKKYASQLGFAVPESTVRNVKRQYLKELKHGNQSPSNVTTLRKCKTGRPPILGSSLDSTVQKYLTML